MATNKLVSTQIRPRALQKHETIDPPAAGLLARKPIIGLFMFIFGTLIFAGLTINLLAHGPLLEWDRNIANTLPAIALQGPPIVQTVMDAGYNIGKDGIVILAILLAVFFIFKRFWKELAMLFIGLAGASALFLSLSGLIARARPPTQIWIVLDIPGFPSGHAVSSVAFFGLLAYLLVPKIRPVFWKVVVVVVAILIIGFIGFSRIFTGGHYLTDVLSGYAVGLAWSGVAYTLIELFVQKRRSHDAKQK